MNNDLISRSALWTDIMMLPHNGDIISSEEVEEAIVNAPAVDAESVRHGFWIHEDERWTRYMCSICRVTGCGGFEKFCPSCGAKMDAEPLESVT